MFCDEDFGLWVVSVGEPMLVSDISFNQSEQISGILNGIFHVGKKRTS